MTISECSPTDIPLLAQMNKMLIEDEKAETDLDLPGRASPRLRQTGVWRIAFSPRYGKN